MLDNQVYQILIPIIQTGLAAQGVSGVQVLQSQQPTQQGINSVPSIYLHKLSNPGYGWQGKTDTPDGAGPGIIHVEQQWNEVDFQASAFSVQDPADINSVTAADLLQIVRMVLQSDFCITMLVANGLGILRIQELRNPYFKNAQDQYQASPSFDFTITNMNSVTNTVAPIDSVTPGFYRI